MLNYDYSSEVLRSVVVDDRPEIISETVNKFADKGIKVVGIDRNTNWYYHKVLIFYLSNK